MVHLGRAQCPIALQKNGRETDVDNDRLRQQVESNPRRTTRELAQELDVIYYDPLARNETITAELYCQQLDRPAANRKASESWHNPILARQCSMTHCKNEAAPEASRPWMGCAASPSGSPDTAPTEYHLFLPLSNAMQGKTFDDEDDMGRWLAGFFESKPEKFYAYGSVVA
ncbi:unnamed protein product [Heligmosomoides polygyrus]|uniref:DDE_Tnp_1_7 domain-containing protein n=1 Tax=Heligmosomoides polygyrus TaxID=6339 RepID=A0A183G8K3_HELPZ|nr:unnamed protein product [Heligmosomoides polygyrus]